MKIGAMFSLLISPSVLVATGLLITSAILFSSINDSLTTQNIVSYKKIKLSGDSPLEARRRPTTTTSPTREIITTPAPRTSQVSSTLAATTTRRSNQGYGYGSRPRPSVHNHGAWPEDTVGDLAFRSNREPKDVEDDEQMQDHGIAKRATTNNRQSAIQLASTSSEAVDGSRVNFEDDKRRSEIPSDDDSRGGGPSKESWMARCNADMFWGVSIAAMVMATLQLLCTCICFTVSTTNTRQVTGIWMICNMIITTTLAILSYLSVHYYTRDACSRIPYFDTKWLLFSVFLVLDTAMIVVLIAYSYYVFKIKDDEVRRLHETDSQRKQQEERASERLLRNAFHNTKSYTH